MSFWNEVWSRPGLGIELNEAVARAHPYEGQALQLERSTDRDG